MIIQRTLCGLVQGKPAVKSINAYYPSPFFVPQDTDVQTQYILVKSCDGDSFGFIDGCDVAHGNDIDGDSLCAVGHGDDITDLTLSRHVSPDI